MGHILDSIVAAVEANQHLAYGLVLVLSFSESLPVLGSLIPGTTIIVAISVLVPSGAVDIWWLLASAILGAILGDGFSYWVGYRYRQTIAGVWPLKRYPQLVELGRVAVGKHGGKSILFARFTPAIRAIVPLVAGILAMDPWRFYLVNVGSAIAWATLHIVPAVIAGATLAVAGAVGGRLLVLILVLAVILWLVALLVRAAVGKGVPLIAQGAVRLWLWARHHDNWVSREILSLLDPSQDELKGLLLLAGFLAVGLWAFFGILSQVVTGDPLQRMDSAVFNFMQDTRTLWADRLMVILTELGDPLVTGAVALAVALWLAARGTWRAAGYWLGALAVASAFSAGLALILHLPRPTPLAGAEGALGLVSSHTAVAGTVYGMLALFVGSELRPRGRLVLSVAIASLVFVIAFSRLYLGVRWTSDVGVGIAFALAWVAGLGLVYLSHRPRSIAPGTLLAIVLPVFAVVGTYHARATFTADMQRYAARPMAAHMAALDWWRGGWATLPARRIDLGGGLDEPLTLQWVGTVKELEARLAQRGWVEPPPWTLASALTWLETGADLSELPVLTRLHDGQPARLILIRSGANPGGPTARLILRVWRSPVEVDVGDGRSLRLWLGAAVEQRLYHVGSFLTFGRAARDENAPRAQLEAELGPTRIVRRSVSPDRSGWDGWVLLAHDPSFTVSDREGGVLP
ncbi:MAG TPA: VTT domain-containing protein [Alphaproteobacteria bacterium]|nr:VTT domain-containing protein [Alphaproteobacteria bacterium]